MIKYQEKLQDFYKMRDTLIAEGYNYPENIETFNKVEKREIALEIIKNKKVDVVLLRYWWECNNADKDILKQYNILLPDRTLAEEEYDLLKEVIL